ncbi:TetR family transcriptional regulator [Amycolatopsis anabasis]|uniref:acyl-CoA-like ligand-binding transcription factor n=1 Tax=Amycolatopsis anabasis TaxID=1840409 RepID=UPI00131BF8C0|nr:TetR family transcriptional regulator [Amycolatopsis anabasis]
MTTETLGLRERKKLATRQALSDAALALALEHGLENVRVEDIAAEAEVSTRTFRNYFSSKYEALAARHLDRARRAALELRERPRDEPLWDAVIHATLAQWDGDDGAADRSPSAEVTAGVRRLLAEPAFQAEVLKAGLAADSEFAAVIAERTGTDPRHDLYPRLVAAAVGATTQVVTDQWLRADPPVPLRPLLRDALRQLAAGLPDPSAT